VQSPIVRTAASKGEGIEQLIDTILAIAEEKNHERTH